MINIRERKYEIGVLRTIGMKKMKVSFQFMLELLIVTIFGLLIGAGIGSFTSVSVANSLMANEIANAKSKYEDIGRNFGRSSIPGRNDTTKEETEEKREEVAISNDVATKEDVDMTSFNFGIAKVSEVESINAVVNMQVLVKLLGIGVLLTLISSLASMVAISRFSPLTILKERS